MQQGSESADESRRQFDLFTAGLLENQPAALPPLQGGRENHIYYTGPQSVCLKNSGSLGQEIANQSFCLFCGNCSSKASVSHSCICVRMCASYNLGRDTRRKEAEVTSASLLPAVCPELLRSESSSVCRFVTLNEKKTFKLCCGRFPLEAK